VDAGRILRAADKPHPDTPLVVVDYLGPAPDIGAYETRDQALLDPRPSISPRHDPVPPDGSVTIKPDADLMFLGGDRAGKHIVSFGTSRAALQPQAELTDANICTPGRLQPGRLITGAWMPCARARRPAGRLEVHGGNGTGAQAMKSILLAIAALLIVPLGALHAAAAAPPADKPNILVILTDDQGGAITARLARRIFVRRTWTGCFARG